MLQMKEEYLAAGLRKQIILLQQLLEDMEKKAPAPDGVTTKIRTVEAELRRLRSELTSLS
jgi:hypothetical protein